MKKFLRILYILFFILAGAWVFTHPVKTETNLLKAIFSNNAEDELIVKLGSKYSSKINVLIEASDPEEAEVIVEKFYNALDKQFFQIKKIDLSKILKIYEGHYKNILSPGTAAKIEASNFEEVKTEAYKRLYNPLELMIIPLDKDPFMLFEDYIQSIRSEIADSVEYNGKYYKVISLEVNEAAVLSPQMLNTKIKNLTDLQTKLSSGRNVNIYLTGTPIHSYYASSGSMVEINIICILSLLFIIGMCHFYFRNLKFLLPIAISLLGGVSTGYLICAVLFPSIHVLTFVFSTTLIGICIDYSLHYFIEKDLTKILKSLTVSMISTVSAFAVLLFSGVELLKQISVFTSAGLISVYFMTVLFYPLLTLNSNERNINFTLNKKLKKIFTIFVLITAASGLFFVKFNDDIRNLYVPSKKLLAAEELFSKITGLNNKTSFAVIEGDNLQQILEKEESIIKDFKNIDYQALSKFLPSIKQQKKNFELREKLYKHSLNSYAEFLSASERSDLLTEQPSPQFSEIPFKEEFLLNGNSSLMVLYDFNEPEIIKAHGAKYIDVPSDISKKIQSCREACLKILVPVFILLFTLSALIYKPKNALKIIIPSITAAIFAISLVSLAGQTINLFHIIAIFLIIGFGLDYSVFRASRLKSSGDAIFLSCSTSVFSFALLACTSFKLISSLGVILSAGLVVSYLTSLLFDYNNEGET